MKNKQHILSGTLTSSIKSPLSFVPQQNSKIAVQRIDIPKTFRSKSPQNTNRNQLQAEYFQRARTPDDKYYTDKIPINHRQIESEQELQFQKVDNYIQPQQQQQYQQQQQKQDIFPYNNFHQGPKININNNNSNKFSDRTQSPLQFQRQQLQSPLQNQSRAKSPLFQNRTLQPSFRKDQMSPRKMVHSSKQDFRKKTNINNNNDNNNIQNNSRMQSQRSKSPQYLQNTASANNKIKFTYKKEDDFFQMAEKKDLVSKHVLTSKQFQKDIPFLKTVNIISHKNQQMDDVNTSQQQQEKQQHPHFNQSHKSLSPKQSQIKSNNNLKTSTLNFNKDVHGKKSIKVGNNFQKAGKIADLEPIQVKRKSSRKSSSKLLRHKSSKNISEININDKQTALNNQLQKLERKKTKFHIQLTKKLSNPKEEHDPQNQYLSIKKKSIQTKESTLKIQKILVNYMDNLKVFEHSEQESDDSFETSFLSESDLSQNSSELSLNLSPKRSKKYLNMPQQIPQRPRKSVFFKVSLEQTKQQKVEQNFIKNVVKNDMPQKITIDRLQNVIEQIRKSQVSSEGFLISNRKMASNMIQYRLEDMGIKEIHNYLLARPFIRNKPQTQFDLKYHSVQMFQKKFCFVHKNLPFNEKAANDLLKDGLQVNNNSSQQGKKQDMVLLEENLGLVAKYRERGLSFDGRCPLYQKGEYVWVKVKVLDYDRSCGKFRVETVDNKMEKAVSRKALIFRDESALEVLGLLQKERKLFKFQQDQNKFDDFVKNVPNSLVSNIDPNLLVKIKYKLEDQVNKNTKPVDEAVYDEINEHFMYSMKKLYVISQMDKKENQEYFQKQNFEKRYFIQMKYPYYGQKIKGQPIITNLTQKLLKKRMKEMNQESFKCAYNFEVIKFQFIQQNRMLRTEFSDSLLPFYLEELQDIQLQQSQRMKISLINEYKQRLVDEMHEKLGKVYNFYEMDTKVYQTSQTRKFVQKLKQQHYQFLKTEILENAAIQWTNFLKRFQNPEQEIEEEEENDKNKIIISKKPLLKIKLQALKQSKRKKGSLENCETLEENEQFLGISQKLKSKYDIDPQSIQEMSNQESENQSSQEGSDDNENENDNDDENSDNNNSNHQKSVISLYPSFQAICKGMTEPLSYIQEVVNNIGDIEQSLMPMISNVNEKRTQNIIENHKFISEYKVKILKHIDQNWKIFVQPIQMKFNKFKHLLDIPEKNIIKSIFYEPSKQELMNKRQSQISSGMNSRFGGKQSVVGQNKYLQNDINQEELFKIHEDNLKQTLQTYKKYIIEVQGASANLIHTPLYEIDTLKCKQQLIGKSQNLLDQIISRLQSFLETYILKLHNYHEEITTKLTTVPQNEKQLLEIKQIINGLNVDNKKYWEEITKLSTLIQILDDNYKGIQEETDKKFLHFYSWPKLLKKSMELAKKNSKSTEKKFIELLQKEKIGLKKLIQSLKEEFQTAMRFSSYKRAKDNNLETQNINEQIKDGLYQVKEFNKREELLDLKITEYPELKDMQIEFRPYVRFWELAFDFQMDKREWLNGPLLKMSYSQVEKKIDTYYSEVIRIQRTLQESNKENVKSTYQVTQKLKSELDAQREQLWMIELLTVEAMIKRPAHFQEIFKLCGIQENIQPNDEMSFQQLLDQGIDQHRTIIEDVSRAAEKEYSLEKKLNEVYDKFKELQLEIVPHKQTNSFVLKNAEDIQDILSDQLTLVIMLKSSPFVKNIARKANEIEQRIITIQDALEEWLKCQRSWVYLEAIFTGDDIKKKMASEAKKFSKIDSLWRNILKGMSENPMINDIDGDRIRMEFEEANKVLYHIQLMLADYLETKRIAFPRFFFLSDEDLLDILARSRDPENFQKHLNKCFEAINQVQFVNKEKLTQCQIVAMISQENEKVQFREGITLWKDPSVEKWMIEIQKNMTRTLRHSFRDCFTSLQNMTDFKNWIFDWPGQIAQLAIATQDTMDAEDAIVNQSLQAYAKKKEAQLKINVELIRQDLSDLQRATLSSLIIHGVHSKDKVFSMFSLHTQSINDFNWQSHSRYYLTYQKDTTVDPDEDIQMRIVDLAYEQDTDNAYIIDGVKLKILNTCLRYGFEYIGNTTRLIITPLTDRCYRTLFSAYKLQYGGSPEGPAGTGKTETVKDLAKGCGIHCVVFNASDGLNHIAMYKFFKGLASSGSWCCFDEFNRIDSEVLSVVAQYITTIQNALRFKKAQFMFEGSEIKLVLTCNFNITMNPGYAGRSELPDNLKALFRPCAMMKADYGMISENYLYSLGFYESHKLSKKIVAAMALASQQLSSQDHYDFGMRTLKSILMAAGSLKRKNPDYQEEIIVLQALLNVNIPKFTGSDTQLFLGITNDLFPNSKLMNTQDQVLKSNLQKVCYNREIIPSESFLDKCMQLFETIQVRHGIILIGQASSGKTEMLETVREALCEMASKKEFKLTPESIYRKVVQHKINPKSISSSILYGQYDDNTKVWTDGVLAMTFRQYLEQNLDKGKLADYGWIIFDGPVDPVWIENMNTVLDDNKKLCLNSGEIIKLTQFIITFFECEDLVHASPATISRCGMIYMEGTSIHWKDIIESFFLQSIIKQIFNERPQQKENLQNFIMFFVDAVLGFLYDKSLNLKLSKNMRVKNFIKFLILMFQDQFDQLKESMDDQQDQFSRKRTDKKVKNNIINQIGQNGTLQKNMIMFSLVWGLCGDIDEQTKRQIDQFLKQIIFNRNINQSYQLYYEFGPYDSYSISEIVLDFGKESGLYDQMKDEQVSFFDLKFSEKKWDTWITKQEKNSMKKSSQIESKQQQTKAQTPLSQDKQQNYNGTIVSTPETIRLQFFLNYLIKYNTFLLLIGPTGTGKSITISTLLQDYYYNDYYTNTVITFSGNTKAQHLQKNIESKMTTRYRKGVYKPEERKEKIIIFLDDINMPLQEKYGAQPPLELLRQWCDNQGWYDLETREFKLLLNMVLIAAMMPRNQFSARLLRHFMIMHIDPFSFESMLHIFNTIIHNHFSRKNFSLEVLESQANLIRATINLYNRIKVTPELLPSPKKSHYKVNLRDISRICQGLLQANPKAILTHVDIIKLWIHETQRVFHDRLICLEDQKIYNEILQDLVRKDKDIDSQEIENVFEAKEVIRFVSFIDSTFDDEQNLVGLYNEVKDRGKLNEALDNFIYEFNLTHTSGKNAKQLNLVLFEDCLDHLIRIIRTISFPFGHSLLVGSGGSGRTSLSNLSAFVLKMEFFVIKQGGEDWREQVKTIMQAVGVENKSGVFFIQDSQIHDETIMEDIAHLLNNGEISELFTKDEKAKIVEEMENYQNYQSFGKKRPVKKESGDESELDRSPGINEKDGINEDPVGNHQKHDSYEGKSETKSKKKAEQSEMDQKTGSLNVRFEKFMQVCNSQLRIIMSMSPVGTLLRQRMRTYPALVNCTTIDWYHPWTLEAYYETASQFIEPHPEISDKFAEKQSNLTQILVKIHQYFQGGIEKVLLEQRRKIFMTPTLFIQFLQAINVYIRKFETEIQSQIEKYDNGIQKIIKTETEIVTMKEDLAELQIKLDKSKEENEIILKGLSVKQLEADQKKQICEQEEKECQQQKEMADKLKSDCKMELDRVLPLLKEAADALSKVTKDDLTLLRSYQNPSQSIRAVMEAMCYVLGVEQNIKFKPVEAGSSQKYQDFWEYAKKFLLNDKLIKIVKNFKEEQIQKIKAESVVKLNTLLSDPVFEKERIFASSEAAGNFSCWIRAVSETYEALQVVNPKREELLQAQESYMKASEMLKEKQSILQFALESLKSLTEEYESARKEKERLQAQVDVCKTRLDRAEKIIEGLNQEKILWEQKKETCVQDKNSVLADAIFCSAAIIYFGVFPKYFRDNARSYILEQFKEKNIACNNNITLQNKLCDQLQLGKWCGQQKLPNDSYSIDNAIILKNSTKWPICIDPQLQANTWIKEMEKSVRFIIIHPRMSVSDLSFKLESGLTLGYPILLENIGETIWPPILEPVIFQKYMKGMKIQLGDKIIDVNKEYRFYATTKLSNPVFSPDITSRTSLLNFIVTEEGLMDQMLNIVVKAEDPLKEQQRVKNINELYENKVGMENSEKKILSLITESKGNDLLDDEKLIRALQDSQTDTISCKKKIKELNEFQVVLDETRNFYFSVSQLVSQLFFVFMDLSQIQHMYQFSLEWYIKIFEYSINIAPESDTKRCQNINETFMKTIFISACRTLEEKDKILVSFMFCTKILRIRKLISSQELRFLTLGGMKTQASVANPCVEFMNDKQWTNVVELCETFNEFGNEFLDHFIEDVKNYKDLFTNSKIEDIISPDQQKVQILSKKFQKSLTDFQKIMFVSSIRPDKVIGLIKNLVKNHLGKEFIEPHPYNLDVAYQETNNQTPLIFILSSGMDPQEEIIQLAERQGKRNGLQIISLGQGQHQIAETTVMSGIRSGFWVLLQNCHLFLSFMPTLERIFDNFEATKSSKNFRLLLTTNSSPHFPVSLLQRGIKLRAEPPSGIKNLMYKAYNSVKQEQYFSELDRKHPQIWQRAFYAVVFFHALIQERKKFGPMGWNKIYEFSEADLSISLKQMGMLIEKQGNNQGEILPLTFENLSYLISEINYGGRVSDSHDRKLLQIILKKFMNSKIFKEDFQILDIYKDEKVTKKDVDGFNQKQKQAFLEQQLIDQSYLIPEIWESQEKDKRIRDQNYFNEHIKVIEKYPLYDTSEIFGMYKNAEIIGNNHMTQEFLDTLLNLIPKNTSNQSESQLSYEQQTKNISNSLLKELREQFEEEHCQRKIAQYQEGSLNAFILQEIMRFNKLIKTIQSTLKVVIESIDGIQAMTQETEEIMESIFDYKVPTLFKKVSYPSNKTLGSWFEDLKKKLSSVDQWIENGKPKEFWIGSFFYTQSFLTGILQNYSRKKLVPIDKLSFTFQVMTIFDKSFELKGKDHPENGAFIYGFYLEGAKWSYLNKGLSESDPGQIYQPLPTIWFKPGDYRWNLVRQQGKPLYKCPVYKTSSRAESVQGSGVSQNWLIDIYLPYQKILNTNEDSWVLRGVAALTQLDT